MPLESVNETVTADCGSCEASSAGLMVVAHDGPGSKCPFI